MPDRLDLVFAALADPTRRGLVARLAGEDATVGQLAEPYDMSVQAVSKHLRVLERAGLVTKSKNAQRRTVRLEAEVFDLMTKWIERYRREAEARYQRLDAVLADLSNDPQDANSRHTNSSHTSSDHTSSDHTSSSHTNSSHTTSNATGITESKERAS